MSNKNGLSVGEDQDSKALLDDLRAMDYWTRRNVIAGISSHG